MVAEAKQRKRGGSRRQAKVRTRALPNTEPSDALAKITRPVLARVYPRTRLFKLLDDARRCPVIWISAPAGSGKTTLVASYLEERRSSALLWYQIDEGDADVASFFYYLGIATRQAAPARRGQMPLLTPQYLLGLPTFTRNYFRELFSRLKRPAILVLDNYQEAPAESAIHDLLVHAWDEVPTGVNVIVLSRSDPPPSLTRLQSNDHLALLRWENIRLTETEGAGIAELRGKKHLLSSTAFDQVFKATQGWAAGLVLMLEQVDPASLQRPLDDVTVSQLIFDYFANEIFQRTEPVVQQFLLKTVFLPKVDVQLAKQLTGNADADAILSDLTRRNYFTVRRAGSDGAYEYHPLLRAFLHSRAITSFSLAQANELRQISAQLLVNRGNVEDAVSLLQQAQDWPTLVCLILQRASIMANQGRTQTLASWLESLPAQLCDDNPWLLYWLGVCRLLFSPSEARGYFERAFVQFESQDDAASLYLTWSGIVDSFVIEWDNFTPMDKWLDMYPSLVTNHGPPTGEIEISGEFSYLTGLVHRRPDDPNLSVHAQRAEALFLQYMNDAQRFSRGTSLMLYYLRIGELAKVEHLLQTYSRSSAISVDPAAHIMWCILRSQHACIVGSPMESVRATNEALALAQTSGIHLFDVLILGYGICGQLLIGDLVAARNWLERMASLVAGRAQVYDSFYLHIGAMVALSEGDIALAFDRARRSVELAKISGVVFGEANCLVALAWAQARSGDTSSALRQLEAALTIGIRMNSQLIVGTCRFVEACIRVNMGEHAHALRLLSAALAICEKSGIVMFRPWCLRKEIAFLYAMALDAGMSVNFVRSVIIKTQLLPPTNYFSEAWPFPIKVYTLGRFALVKDDEPMSFGGKAQKKPLDLLKALIALGGRGVGAEVLVESLWPDPSVDGKNLFDNTLHRLRKLLGCDDAILMQEGKLTLNPQVMWVDVWAFERLVGRIPKRDGDANTKIHFDRDAMKAFQLYQGHFLAREGNLSWMLAPRERLRSKFARHLAAIGQYREQMQSWGDAIDLYRRGIELDNLSEEFYRRLMYCYLKLGDHAEAVNTYRRCRETLSIVLGVKPSADTELLHQQIRTSSAKTG